MLLKNWVKKLPHIGLALAVFTTIGLTIPERSQATDWVDCGIRGCYQESASNDSPFPDSIANSVLQTTSQRSGFPVSELRVSSTKKVIWRDGCMGVYQTDSACTMALVEGWVVTVEKDQQQWIYHTDDNSRISLSNGTTPGSNQENPIIPDTIIRDRFIFENVPTGRWFDPPVSSGFTFKTISDSLFTEILDFPIGIDADNQFAVIVGSILLGHFSPGQNVDFGRLLGTGVSEFTISDINSPIDFNSFTAFPIKLAFDTETASFSMQGVKADAPADVPEPISLLGSLTFGAFSFGWRLKRRSNLSS